MSDCSFLYRVFNFHRSSVLTALFGCYMADATWNRCHLGAFRVHHTTMHHVTSLHAMQHRRMLGAGFACLAVTCHLHFWQNGRDLLRATAVTRGWNRYRNKSQLQLSLTCHSNRHSFVMPTVTPSLTCHSKYPFVTPAINHLMLQPSFICHSNCH